MSDYHPQEFDDTECPFCQGTGFSIFLPDLQYECTMCDGIGELIISGPDCANDGPPDGEAS